MQQHCLFIEIQITEVRLLRLKTVNALKTSKTFIRIERAVLNEGLTGIFFKFGLELLPLRLKKTNR